MLEGRYELRICQRKAEGLRIRTSLPVNTPALRQLRRNLRLADLRRIPRDCGLEARLEILFKEARIRAGLPEKVKPVRLTEGFEWFCRHSARRGIGRPPGAYHKQARWQPPAKPAPFFRQYH